MDWRILLIYIKVSLAQSRNDTIERLDIGSN